MNSELFPQDLVFRTAEELGAEPSKLLSIGVFDSSTPLTDTQLRAVVAALMSPTVRQLVCDLANMRLKG